MTDCDPFNDPSLLAVCTSPGWAAHPLLDASGMDDRGARSGIHGWTISLPNALRVASDLGRLVDHLHLAGHPTWAQTISIGRSLPGVVQISGFRVAAHRIDEALVVTSIQWTDRRQAADPQFALLVRAHGAPPPIVFSSDCFWHAWWNG